MFDLSRPAVSAGVQCPIMGFCCCQKKAFWVFWVWNNAAAKKTFSYWLCGVRARWKADSFATNSSSLQEIRDLGFLVTVPVVIPVTQEEPNNRHRSWKNKLLFMYGSLSNIPASQLMRNDLNSELRDNCTYKPAMQYFYLWTKWKELDGTACLLNYIRNNGLIFWRLKYVCVCQGARFKILFIIWPVFQSSVTI